MGDKRTFQHKIGYVRDKVLSGDFVQQWPKRKKDWESSFKLLC